MPTDAASDEFFPFECNCNVSFNLNLGGWKNFRFPDISMKKKEYFLMKIFEI